MKLLLILVILGSVSCSHSKKRQLASGLEEEEKKEGFYELVKPNIKRSYLEYSENNLQCKLQYEFVEIGKEVKIKYSEIEDLNYDDMIKVRGLIEKYSQLFYKADQAVTEEQFDFKGELKEEGDLDLMYYDDQGRESWAVLNLWQLSEVSDSGFKGQKLEIIDSKFVPRDILEQERSFLISICQKAKQ